MSSTWERKGGYHCGLEDNQAAVEELYKKLMDPNPEFEKCFEAVEDLYSVYYRFTKLAISPSGSLKNILRTSPNMITISWSTITGYCFSFLKCILVQT